jgi:hypothetical protein
MAGPLTMPQADWSHVWFLLAKLAIRLVWQMPQRDTDPGHTTTPPL